MALREKRRRSTKGIPFAKRGLFERLMEEVLPFALTASQKRVIEEISQDMARGYQMNRLLQGDVGSGKTIVAFSCMLAAIESGAQVALMVPTEVLADQHLYNLSQYAAPLGIEVAKLSRSTPKKDRELLYKKLKGGDIQLLIGTHALLEEWVQFKKMGLVIIDEQHRFGVGQRAALWKKTEETPPHVLIMTATPIPRTLAMTRYGDLDVSLIDEVPAGRKPTRTVHRYYKVDGQTTFSFSSPGEKITHRIYNFIQSELKAGRQAYVVYPLIEGSDTLSLRHLEEGYHELCTLFSSLR